MLMTGLHLSFYDKKPYRVKLELLTASQLMLSYSLRGVIYSLDGSSGVYNLTNVWSRMVVQS